ncbi:uncharacterized protein LOC110181577 isoform X2 [Drosophila serrata]|uniref:uncharacterized protein LOC110181577 isoform X2 n=1 Tax=Drosophila serrata TaxID=7274 RepID=UPI000A1CF9CE|nr:uncharacterized protein LOC110181577 isoform X2 [Drosophila serrata]
MIEFKYIVLLISLTIIGGSQAATLPYRSSAYVYNPQFCMDTLTGHSLYVGEVFTRPGQCVRVQCLGTLQLWEDSCQVPNLKKGDCKQVPPKETGVDYPRCCPLYECKSYETHSGGTLEQTNTYNHYGTLLNTHLTEVITITTRPLQGHATAEIPTAPVRKYQV